MSYSVLLETKKKSLNHTEPWKRHPFSSAFRFQARFKMELTRTKAFHSFIAHTAFCVSSISSISIAGDPTHPTHSFFSLLPSGRRLRSLQARTSRLKDSFIHQAVRKLNSLPSLPPLPSFTPRNTEL